MKRIFYLFPLVLWIISSTAVYASLYQKAVIATTASDWSSGAISIVNVLNLQDYQNDLLPGKSDITVASYGDFFYKIGRYNIDTIAKFRISDPTHPLWECSTIDSSENISSSNPHAIVFISPTKAYLLRYGSTKAWIINPSATSCSNLKIGTLDLSAYADSDGLPEMTSGVVVNDKVFVVLQRLDRDNGWARNTAYVAVFNATTDQEIDTNSSTSGLKGIELPIKDPSSIQYVEGKIYVQGAGKFPSSWSGTPGEYTGGIISIDPNTYQTQMIVDDGNDTTHPYGNISGMIIVNSQKGYFVGYHGWGNNTLYSFNPTNGTVYGAVPGLDGINIAGMENGGAVDMLNRAWITDATNHRMVILNTNDNSQNATVDTNLNPQKIVFVKYWKTTAQDKLDNNMNGIADAFDINNATEVAQLDFNGDGIPDNSTINATCKVFESPGNRTAIKMEISSGSSITKVTPESLNDISDNTGKRPSSMPYGLLDFITTTPTGGNSTVTVYFTTALDNSTYRWYKYTTGKGWQDFTSHVISWTVANGTTTIKFWIQDGGAGDNDGLKNGRIEDPSGPGIPPATTLSSSGTGSGGGGCIYNPHAGFDPIWCVLLIYPIVMVFRKRKFIKK